MTEERPKPKKKPYTPPKLRYLGNVRDFTLGSPPPKHHKHGRG